jgi:hypothetical protein
MWHRTNLPRLGRGTVATLFLLTTGAVTRPAAAQHVTRGAAADAVVRVASDRLVGSADITRTFELRARGGLARQLDDGYRRHLDWHAAAGERWAWYLWEVTNGERAGLYVDGTLAHAWADFDAAVNPPGDRADNDVNVDPFATRAANHVWRFRPELSGASVDPETAPLVLRTEYHVGRGAEGTFVSTLQQLRASAATRPYAVYELVSGGELPTYVLWVPAATWVDAGAFADRIAPITRALATDAEHVRAELWRFRPDLSLCRTAAARCHGTLRGGANE